MKKIVWILLTFLLFSCGGGGGEESSEGPNTTFYIGFVNEDFSDKTLYYTEKGSYAKCVFYKDGSLRAYVPGQNQWFRFGVWRIDMGKLVIAPASNKNDETVYTLSNDNEEERYFTIVQHYPNEEPTNGRIYYDQETGLEQAMEFAAKDIDP